MKRELLERVGILLLKEGYTIKSLTQTCFDILARSNERILLIKILEDANSLTNEYASAMSRLAGYVQGSPLIIAEKAGSLLQDGVVYSRFGIFCVTINTFKHCLQNRFPIIFRDQSGLTAFIKGKDLREIREKEGYSLSLLSKKIGVSKRMIQQYENQESKITIAKAIKMRSIFGDKIFDKLDVFSKRQQSEEEPKSDLTRKYGELGFKAIETKKVPFDIIAKMDRELILTEVGDKPRPGLEPISQMLGADRLVIYKKNKPKKIPGLKKKEFLEFDKAYELVQFLKEY
ncbi:MAG: helix-turn-helix domain-containing protein [Candidatus Woesearchaeota archaeon]